MRSARLNLISCLVALAGLGFPLVTGAQYGTRARENSPQLWRANEARIDDSGVYNAAPIPVPSAAPTPAPFPEEEQRNARPLSLREMHSSPTPAGPRVLPASSVTPVDSPFATTSDAPLPLAPPSERRQKNGPSAASSSASKTSLGGITTTMLAGLGIVLGLFFVSMWFLKKANPRGIAGLPKEVVEPLGRAPLSGRQTLQMLRVGNKVILLCVSPLGVETLTEITDTAEVERITSLCQQSQPGSMTATFRQVLAELGNEPAAPGFLGDPRREELAIAGGSRRRVRRGDDA